MRVFLYFCGMKKRLLGIGSLFVALVVLFVSMDWDVKFHYCTEDHTLTGSFVDAAASCLHCHGHEHEHETHAVPQHGLQLNARCCCEDFESLIQFTDNFVFSSDKQLTVYFQPFVLAHLDLLERMPKVQQFFHLFTLRKIPHFCSARELLVFFSALRLNPLVF